jgi:hypothetical protein
VTLSKNEFFNAEFKGIELENIEAADKRNLKSNMVCESKASLAKLKTIRRRTDWQYYLKH